MAQSRPSYTYNPDLPTRKWHQKWINPMISLQNAPPTSHGTPAPTKEDGEVGHAGFRVRAWIPMDEDDDVTDEMLQQDVDWWSKPGAPLRPDALSKSKITASSATPVVDTHPDVEDNTMQIDPPNEPAVATNGASADVAPSSSPTEDPPKAPSPALVSLNKSPPPTVDTEMPDASSSPVHLPTVLGSSHSPQPSPSTMQHPSPAPQLQPTEPADQTKSPPNPAISPAVEASSTEDIIMQSQSSPQPDPLPQTREVADAPTVDTPNVQIENVDNTGGLIENGSGIASEEVVRKEIVDIQDANEVAQDVVAEGNPDEEMISQEAEVDKDAENIKGDTLE
jgi:hypothetical protein